MNQEPEELSGVVIKQPKKSKKVVTETVQVVDDTYNFQHTVPPMKMLFIIHGYADRMGSGAERMVQSMSEFFVKKGHDVTIAVKRPKAGEYGGVKIVACKSKAFEATVKDYDVVLSHLDLTNYAMDLARDNKKPFVWICHNTHNYVTIRNRTKYAHVIYNAEWVKTQMGYPNNSIVLTPPTDYRKWDDGVDHSKCEYVTLVNHNMNKGGKVLIEVAKLMPEQKFLAVEGAYDVQVLDKTVRNIKYIPNQADMREVYKQSRIVIMPSEYESWGLVASEAAAAGIPVICTGTHGLRENMGDAAILIDEGERKDYTKWVDSIKSLDDSKRYAEQVSKGKARVKEQDPYGQLANVENWIYGIWESYNK